jgi:collagenase-like PrtC family protease
MINYLEELSDIGVNTIRIDSFLHNEIWIKKKAKEYLNKIKQVKSTHKIKETHTGFYTFQEKDLIYLKDNDKK